MATCEYCGCEFDPEEAEEEFESEYWLSYRNFRKCLCGDCAKKAIEYRDDGVIFETCECCGKEFDVIEEEAEYDRHFPSWNGVRLRDHWTSRILCASCAIEHMDELYES